MSDWTSTTLGQVVKLQRGHDLPTQDRREGVVPIVGSFGVTGWHDEAKTRGPGVTIGRSGSSMGTAVYMAQDFWPLNTCLYVTDFCGNDPLWVYALLHEMDFSGYNSGSAQPSLNRNFVSSIPVELPPVEEQRQIASVVSALDDLIELNRRTIESLRALAISLFDASTAEGQVVPFADVVVRVREGVSGAALAPGTPYLGLEHFGTEGSGIVDLGDAGSVDSNKSRFAAGDVLYGQLRPYFRKFDRPGFDGVCSTEIWVLRAKGPFGPATVHAIVSRPEFTDFAMQGSGGTRMPRADWNHVATMPVAVPPESERAAVEQRLNDIWMAVVGLTDEIADLTGTRHEMLPLLMSGKVRVLNIEGGV